MCLTELCKERAHLCPLSSLGLAGHSQGRSPSWLSWDCHPSSGVVSGTTPSSPHGDPRSQPGILAQPPALQTPPSHQRPADLTWGCSVSRGHTHPVHGVMLSGAKANFPHHTSTLRIIPFPTPYFTHVQINGSDCSETLSYYLHHRLKEYTNSWMKSIILLCYTTRIRHHDQQ